MQIPTKGTALRIYLGANLNRGTHIPVFESVLMRARMMKLAGATIYHCQKGFGAAEVKGSSDYKMSPEDPVIIEIVDSAEKIQEFIPVAQQLLQTRGLMTTHDVDIVHQGERPGAKDE